jgi:GntR family transcriptional regulator, rspAB operon transcriptional repressor
MIDSLKDFVIESPALIRSQVYDKLKQEILSGSIPPGSQLLEGRLAKQLDVSRTPVREALHVLEMEGFLESFPRIGYRVRQITWEEVIEINEIRAVLEPLAARKAIEREDQTYIDLLERVLKQSEATAEQDLLNLFFQYDAAFDEIIVKASGMKTLLDIWPALRQRMSLYKIRAQTSLESRLRSIKGHGRIIECLKGKDKDAVKTAIREHLEDSKQDIKQFAFAGSYPDIPTEGTQ